MNSVIKAAEQKCIELGQKKRSRKFTFELFEQRMANMKDQWTEELWPYEEANYIANRLTDRHSYRIHYIKDRHSEEYTDALQFYYSLIKVKGGSDKKPCWQVVPVIRVGSLDNRIALYLPTLDAFFDGSSYIFSGKTKLYTGTDVRWFDYDNPYERFCLNKMIQEIKKCNPNSKYLDKNIFIQ